MGSKNTISGIVRILLSTNSLCHRLHLRLSWKEKENNDMVAHNIVLFLIHPKEGLFVQKLNMRNFINYFYGLDTVD